MKSTGVIRRIDDLGRIVIPKEIRRNLKIREGDTLEIYVDGNRIILDKFSMMSDIVTMANKLVSIASNLIKKDIIITNLDKVIAASKGLEKKYLDKELSSLVREKIDDRADYFQTNKDSFQFILDETEECSFFLSPIIASSDTVGAVILFDKGDITDSDVLMTKMLSSFLIKNVEE